MINLNPVFIDVEQQGEEQRQGRQFNIPNQIVSEGQCHIRPHNLRPEFNRLLFYCYYQYRR